MYSGSQYVPLAWYQNGYYNWANELRASVHSSLGIRTPCETPPPPYTEKVGDVIAELPGWNGQRAEKSIIYAAVRKQRPRLSMIEEASLPSSRRSSIASSQISELDSANIIELDSRSVSSASSVSSDHSPPSSPGFAPRTLRSSRRRKRSLSLRELRAKDSEAALGKAYSSTVDAYLSGEIFDNFKTWPEPILEETWD